MQRNNEKKTSSRDKLMLHGASRRCRCDNPCSTSAYGRCVYVYPDADKRLFPGIIRDTPQWAAYYAKRVAVERSIGSFKAVLGLERRKTCNTSTTKADLLLAGIVQLLCVVLADRLHDPKLARRVRKLARRVRKLAA